MIPIRAETLQAIPRNVVDSYLKPGLLNLAALPPLSLYVHFPWCVRKCPYCDFNSHEAGSELAEQAYLSALRADLEQSLPLIWGRKIVSIFIGGGTPSLMSAAGLDQLMSDIRSLLPLEPNAEITMEANPGTFEAEKFISFAASGVNRLSIGIQSFNDKHLKSLGRIHDADEARRAIAIAQHSFENINLDLMYGLPDQTLAESEHDLNTALSFETHHLSLYHLTMEANTVFAKYPPDLPDDDATAAMQQMLIEKTAVAGYQNYEITAYAVYEEAEISREELGFEFMINALRLTDGFEVRQFSERTGLTLQTVESALDKAEAKGLIHRDHLKIAPTELGRRFLNDLQQIFLPD